MPPKDVAATIDERSKFGYGVVITITLTLFGAITMISGGVWWASSVSTRLGSIEQYMVGQNGKVAMVDQLDARLKMVETYGAPPTKLSVDQLNKEVADIRRVIDLIQARMALPTKP